MNSKRLTLEQATKYYLRGLSLAIKQINYLDSSNDKEINDIAEAVSIIVFESWSAVFVEVLTEVLIAFKSALVELWNSFK